MTSATFNSARMPRLLLAALLTVFLWVTLAHAGHDHTQDSQQQHIAQVCDFCASLSHLATPPRSIIALLTAAPVDETPPSAVATFVAIVSRVTDQARAPPR